MVHLTSLLLLTTTLTTAASLPPLSLNHLNRRAPPNIPSPEEATDLLSSLTVAPQGPQDGYDRDKFPHWKSDGNCTTRETVLARDGTDLTIGDDCYPESGSWYSVYDGATWSKASDVDIDHVVPLSNAWKSGAADWTNDEREGFANDLENPQLIAVTDEVNQEKSDAGPEEWKPPLEAYHCEYACMWVKVKSVYSLTITDAEKSALTEMLETC
ncbi:hypothetical protein AJ79_02005 [Helicocarpus griseus UAMH5409]|uniref:GmrSD restriction endonucleases C-terminal domain-containing protein n=1 Tax=Helicocarpus griseus UAMH5409 TaxID=1447875 RepID=A0A2B7Y487_9EURO|nr:hypothetical protein AJ79_02005 [Helicocarpus griseus UAMH5409]